MGWLLHCNTGSLRKHKPSVPCSILLSNNYVIIKACSSISLDYSKKVNLKVFVRLSFHDLPSFLGKEKFAKCTYFVTGHCFIHPPLICATQSLIISLLHTAYHFALVCLAKVSLSIMRVILWRWSVKALILSSLRC